MVHQNSEMCMESLICVKAAVILWLFEELSDSRINSTLYTFTLFLCIGKRICKNICDCLWSLVLYMKVYFSLDFGSRSLSASKNFLLRSSVWVIIFNTLSFSWIISLHHFSLKHTENFQKTVLQPLVTLTSGFRHFILHLNTNEMRCWWTTSNQ